MIFFKKEDKKMIDWLMIDFFCYLHKIVLQNIIHA